MNTTMVHAGAEVLRRRARDIATEEIGGAYLNHVIGTMRRILAEAGGVGLAAPQIAEPVRVAIVEDRPGQVAVMEAGRAAELERIPFPFSVLINPVVEAAGEDSREFLEGCLSVPGYRALVRRHRAVRARYLDEQGRPRESVVTGWPARIFQHEVDHLDGILYIDRMESRSFMTDAIYAERWQNGGDEELRAVYGIGSPVPPAGRR